MKTCFLLLFLTPGLLMVAAGGTFAQDPMAQWKPSAGDKFVYADTSVDGLYWNGFPYTVTSSNDTLTMEILNTDSAYSDSYQHVVTVLNSFTGYRDPYKTFYYYRPGSNGLSPHPFAIDVGGTLCTGCPGSSYDFSIATNAQVMYRSDTLDVYTFMHDSNTGDQNAIHRIGAEYSKAFKWFYSQSHSTYESQDASYSYGSKGSLKLISATTVHSAVQPNPGEEDSPLSLQQSDHFLTIMLHDEVGGPFTISLHDPLARPIRSWEMQAEDARRQIILNIADLPSGIYFLILEAPKKTTVRKLAIVR